MNYLVRIFNKLFAIYKIIVNKQAFMVVECEDDQTMLQLADDLKQCYQRLQEAKSILNSKP